MKIAIFGGSFNPVHNGHLKLCEFLQKEFNFDHIHLILANIPPHKKLAAGASDEDRFNMLKIATSRESLQQENINRGTDLLKVLISDDRELKRGGISYTYDTVLELEALYGKDTEIYLIIGEDLLPGFYTWHNAELLIKRCKIIVAKRPCSSETQKEQSCDKVKPDSDLDFPYISIENPQFDISSTEIRDKIKENIDETLWCSLVPLGVSRYIMENKLYGYKN